MFVMSICFLFLFLTETITSLSVTCHDKGNSVVFVNVTVILDDNNDDGKLRAAVVLSVVVGDVTVIVVDENDVCKVLPLLFY